MILIFTLLFALIQASRGYSDVPVGSLTPSQGITFTTQGSSASFGQSVSHAGDFNGDGYDDVIIGAWGETSNSGAVYVLFGTKNGLSDFDVSSGLSASQGMVIYGEALGDFLGYSVSYAGDINNDKIDDIIIGAYMFFGAKGAAYVIYGSKTPPASIHLSGGLAASEGFSVIGASFSDYLGRSVSYAGDVNKDDIDDVIIGAPGVSSSIGAAYVIFGKTGTRSQIDMGSALAPANGFAIKGVSPSDSFGTSVSGAGDLDGDGFGDILIGAPGANLGIGVVYIVYGKTSPIAPVDLSYGWVTPGFSIGGASSSSGFGCSVSNAGDFNGDGKADFLVGADGEASKGAAYAFFGDDRSSLINIDLNYGLPSPSRGIRIGEASANTELGVSVRAAGDINKDGIDDIIVGAKKTNADSGAAYVIFGSKSFGGSGIFPSAGLPADEGFGILGDQTSDILGVSVSFAGDMNKDGMPDLIVGASGVDSGKGAAYVLFSPVICPEECQTCKTTTKCLSCKTGYGLWGVNCVICPAETELVNGICQAKKSSLGTAAEISKNLFNSGSAASRLLTMGRSLSVSLGLIAKIIQNVRFLDIQYSKEALNAFETYGTDVFELPVPEAFYKSPQTKALPYQYARYNMEPSFIENYWDTILMILISLGSFAVVKGIQFLTNSQRKDHIFQVALKNIAQTFANFFIIQIYANLDDVIFYMVLDIQSTKLRSASAGVSLGMAILFLLIGLALVYFHCWLLGKYQQAKSQGNLKTFETKYQFIGTLYEDFNDDSIAKQCFFGILILRCVILVLVIMLLRPQWMQGTLLMLTNLLFLAYFIYYRPFKSRFDEVVQYLCEFTVFAAYLCVLILSILDAQKAEKLSLRNGMGKCIVIAGIVLALGGFLVQMIQTVGTIIDIYKFIRKYYARKEGVQVEKLDHSTSESAILKHRRPIHVSDQLELLNVPHKTKKISQKDLETPSFNLEDQPVFHNILPRRAGDHMNNSSGKPEDNSLSRKAGKRINLQRQENFQRAAVVGQSRFEVVLRPLGSRVHQERGPSKSPERPTQANHHHNRMRRNKMKRNKVRPDMISLDDTSIGK